MTDTGAIWLAAALVVAGVLPGRLVAQERGGGALHFSAGGAAGLLVGEGSDFLDGGLGAWASVAWHHGGRVALGVVGTAEWLPLEEDSDRLTGAHVDNTLVTLLAGPTLGVRTGPALPWIGAFAGSVTSRWDTRSSRGQGDGSGSAFAWGSAAGLRIRVSGGGHPVALGAEARITDAGTLPFARAPAVDDPTHPTGILTRDVVLLSLRLGISVGL